MKNQEIETLRDNAKTIIRELGLLDVEYKNSGLTLSECHLLQEIDKHPLQTVGDLAMLLNLEKSTMSRLCSKMVVKGHIEYAADSDKRRRLLRMTKKGRALVSEINSIAHTQVKDALTRLNQQEQQIVFQGIKLYANSLRQSRQRQQITIKELTKKEAVLVTKILLEVLKEYNCNRPGFASQDEELHDFYKAYQKSKTKYFVAYLGDKIVGGAGIAPLQGGDGKTCELRKMYLLKDARGLGIGSLLLEQCLQAAKKLGFSRCYLETTDAMKDAINLYLKKGFEERSTRLGETGHWGCEKFYEKKL